MTETNRCPPRPEIWECSTNKGSATAPPHYSTEEHFVDFAPIFSIYFCAHDMGEAGKKLVSIGVNRIDRGFRHDPVVTDSDIKAEKSLYRY
jgi:hypothetical protein